MKKFGKLFKNNVLNPIVLLVNFGWQILFAIIGLCFGESFSVVSILEGTLVAQVMSSIIFALIGWDVKDYIKFPSRKVGK